MSPQGTLWRQMQLWFEFIVFQYKTCPSPSWHLFAIICIFLRRNVPFSVKPQMISQGILNEEGLWDHLTPDPYFRIPDLIYVQLGQGHSADWHKVQRENPGPLPSSAVYTLCVITPIMLLKVQRTATLCLQNLELSTGVSLPPHLTLFCSLFSGCPFPLFLLLPSLPWATMLHLHWFHKSFIFKTI